MKYTVATAPDWLRKKWRRKALRTRKLCSKWLTRTHKCEKGLTPCRPCGSSRTAEIVKSRISTPFTPAPSIYGATSIRPRESSLTEDADRLISANYRRKNPELLVVHNPCRSRLGRNPRVKLVIRRGETAMRRRRRRKNPRVVRTIRYKGRRASWRSLVKRFGVKGAKKIWRKSKKYLGKCRIGGKRRKSRRRRKAHNRRRRFHRRRR